MRKLVFAFLTLLLFSESALTEEACSYTKTLALDGSQAERLVTICTDGDSIEISTRLLVGSIKETRPAKIVPINNEESGNKPSSNKDKQSKSPSPVKPADFPSGPVESVRKDPAPKTKPKNKIEDTKAKECSDSGLALSDRTTCEDLDAQKEMAEGTSVMSLAADRTVKISVAGLLFLIGSFIAAWRAAHHTKRTADAAENAEKALVTVAFELKFVGPEIDDQPTAKKTQFVVVPVISNHGRSPAFDFSVHIGRENWNTCPECGSYDPDFGIFHKAPFVAAGENNSITLEKLPRQQVDLIRAVILPESFVTVDFYENNGASHPFYAVWKFRDPVQDVWHRGESSSQIKIVDRHELNSGPARFKFECRNNFREPRNRTIENMTSSIFSNVDRIFMDVTKFDIKEIEKSEHQ